MHKFMHLVNDICALFLSWQRLTVQYLTVASKIDRHLFMRMRPASKSEMNHCKTYSSAPTSSTCWLLLLCRGGQQQWLMEVNNSDSQTGCNTQKRAYQSQTFHNTLSTRSHKQTMSQGHRRDMANRSRVNGSKAQSSWNQGEWVSGKTGPWVNRFGVSYLTG